MPIYELVRFSTAADHVGARLPNLRRAWDEYIQQFDPCRCAPCRYNGLPVLTGTSCKCLCKSGYQGEACEETLRRGESEDVRFQRIYKLFLKLNHKHLLKLTTRQTQRQTALGPAGETGRPARRREKPGAEPAITPPQMVEEPLASAPLFRTSAVRRSFRNDLLFVSKELPVWDLKRARVQGFFLI